MQIIFWMPDGKIVERIYLNIPKQNVVSVWLKKVVPSAGYRWDYQLVVATNAFFDQPELQAALINSVARYVVGQLNVTLQEAGIRKTMNTITWDELVAARKKLGVTRTKKPSQRSGNETPAAQDADDDEPKRPALAAIRASNLLSYRP